LVPLSTSVAGSGAQLVPLGALSSVIMPYVSKESALFTPMTGTALGCPDGWIR
jgi:hypothetical protein